MDPTQRVKVLSRHFKENVQLVAAMCPSCYKMEDECKVVGITRKLAVKSNKLLRNKQKRNMLQGNSSHSTELSESHILIESDTDCDIISISSTTSCSTDSSEDYQSEDSSGSSNCTSRDPLSIPPLNLVKPLNTLQDTSSQSESTDNLSEIDDRIDDNGNTSSSCDVPSKLSPKLQSNQPNSPKNYYNILGSPTSNSIVSSSESPHEPEEDNEDHLEEPQAAIQVVRKVGELHQLITNEDILEDSLPTTTSIRKPASPSKFNASRNPSKSSTSPSSILTECRDIQENLIAPQTLIDVVGGSLRKEINESGNLEKQSKTNLSEDAFRNHSKSIAKSPSRLRTETVMNLVENVEKPEGNLHKESTGKKRLKFANLYDQLPIEDMSESQVNPNIAGSKSTYPSKYPNLAQSECEYLQYISINQPIKLTESKGSKHTLESPVKSQKAIQVANVDPGGIVFKESIKKNKLKFDKLYDKIREDPLKNLEVSSLLLRSSESPLQNENLENTSKSNLSGLSPINTNEIIPTTSAIEPNTLAGSNLTQHLTLIPHTQSNTLTEDGHIDDNHLQSQKLSKLLNTSPSENQMIPHKIPPPQSNLPTIIENYPQIPPKPPKSPDNISLLEFEQFFKETITKLNEKYELLSQTDSSDSDNEESDSLKPQRLFDDTNTNRSTPLSEVAIPIPQISIQPVKEGIILDTNIPIENSSKFRSLLDDTNTNTIFQSSSMNENDIPVTDTLRCEGENLLHFVSPNHPQFCVDTSTNTNLTTTNITNLPNNTSSYFSQPLPNLDDTTVNTISESNQRSQPQSVPLSHTNIPITGEYGKESDRECQRSKPVFISCSQPAPILEHNASEDIRLSCSQPIPSERKSRKSRKNVLTRKQKRAILEENDTEMPPGALKAMWTPPKSPHCLIEEEYFRNPWGLLVASIFLNKTSGVVAKPYIDSFLKNYPTPEAVVERSPEDFEGYFEALGLRKRSRAIWRMSQEFLTKKWRHARQLHGIGKYGDDAFRIFCIGDLEVEPKDRYLKIYHAWVKMKQRDESRDN